MDDLARSLRTLLRSQQYSQASTVFLDTISTARFSNPGRFRAFDKAISLFIEFGFFIGANEIYARMKHEGFIPSASLRGTMHVLTCISSSPSVETLLSASRAAFEQDSYDERCLRFFLRILVGNRLCAPEVIENVVEVFLETRPPGYTLTVATASQLAYVLTRLGYSAHAKQWLNPDAKETIDVGKGGDEKRVSVEEEETLLEMARLEPELAPIFLNAVRHMRMTGSRLNPNIYNTLIAALVRGRRYDRTFAIFRLSMQAGHNPSAQAFGSLFKAIRHCSLKRSIRTRGGKLPPNAPSLRELFRNMLQAHWNHTQGQLADSSPSLNSSVLNKAIEAFMVDMDYPATLVALKTFQICRIPVSLGIYRTALQQIMERIEHELPRINMLTNAPEFWAYRFLGYPDSLDDIDIDINLLQNILLFGREPHMDLYDVTLRTVRTPADRLETQPKSSHSPPTSGSNYRIPTPLMILHLELPPVDSWDLVPLERIIKRVVLAMSRDIIIPPHDHVVMKVAEAKAEMLPFQLLQPKPRRDRLRCKT
ncbi:hypothetical protein EW026_g4465 [Hermanssonia centrifuga]|uniref:Pentatricopeptide repeat-containing protein n=1 Tax=Hermanssonia centrifuga TaxID=98765 RepID=A0A4S4KH24_9APHY|nr:hypothetical protein EW026_g4465 [Hermanssonia centrifuga]